LVVSEYDVIAALRRAVNDGRIENKSDTESAPADGAAKAEYVLGGEAKRITIDRIEEGDRLESGIRVSWLAKVNLLTP